MSAVFGRYELRALLADAELAEIRLARDAAAGNRNVVVRRLHARMNDEEELRNRFLDEARINSLLQHPNILPVFELGKLDGRFFCATAYLEGMPLTTLMIAANLPVPLATQLATQAALGLHAAHEARSPEGNALEAVHREVSPVNLLVGFDGALRVAGFGIHKGLGRRSRAINSALRGTPAYMAPEQITLDATIDRRVDVFALGVVLWEMLAKKRLFARSTVEETHAVILDSDAPAIGGDISGDLEAVVKKALARNAEDRFATAEELARALSSVSTSSAAQVRAFVAESFDAEKKAHQSLIASLNALRAGSAPLFPRATHGLKDQPWELA